MPTIACPDCGKQYKVPAAAAGQVAKCACGKRFKIGVAAPSSIAASTVAARSTAETAVATAVAPKRHAAAPFATQADDAFWDDALKAEQTAKVLPPPTPPASPPSSTVSASRSSYPTNQTSNSKPAAAPKKKKRKKSGGIRWGFDWGKVAGGLMTFLIAGGITFALLMSTGRIFFWPAGVAIVGLFTCLSGLMGEEGIW